MANFLRKVKRNQKKRAAETGSFDPELDLEWYLDFFMTTRVLKSIAEKITTATEEQLSNNEFVLQFQMYLSETNMFNEEAWDIAKRYTQLTNEIGGVLLPKPVEDRFSEEELRTYYLNNFKIYVYMNIEYRLFFREYVLIKIYDRFDISQKHKDKIVETIFPNYTKFYKNFTELLLNIDKDVIPEYFNLLASPKANKFVADCGRKKINCNTKMLFAFGTNKDKRESLSDDELYEKAKNLLEIASEFLNKKPLFQGLETVYLNLSAASF